jgi:hypothetical protein
MLKDGLGCWKEALAAFLMQWSQPRAAGTKGMRHGHVVT